MVSAALFDTETTERSGWINRALPAVELDGVVDDLARAIASHAQRVVRAATDVVDATRSNLAVVLTLNIQLLSKAFSALGVAALTRELLAAGAKIRVKEKPLEALLNKHQGAT